MQDGHISKGAYRDQIAAVVIFSWLRFDLVTSRKRCVACCVYDLVHYIDRAGTVTFS